MTRDELHYRLTGPLARLLDPILPTAMHRGKRAARSLSAANIATPMPRRAFEREYLASLWQCHRLLQLCAHGEITALRRFISERVSMTSDRLRECDPGRGLIVASPHYGAFIPGCLKILEALHGRKKVNVLYNDPAKTPSNAMYGPTFQRLGHDVELLFAGRRGTLAAMKALKRGECLLILPDAVLDPDAAIAVPFFDRLLQVMPGVGFFSRQCDAPILPLYCQPRSDYRVELEFAPAIDPRDFHEDAKQGVFEITRALFAEFERGFAATPAHWNYWDRLANQSQPLPRLDSLGAEGIRATLVDRLRQSPFQSEWQRIEPLLRGAA